MGHKADFICNYIDNLWEWAVWTRNRSTYRDLLHTLNWKPIWQTLMISRLCLYYKQYHLLRYAPRYLFPAPREPVHNTRNAEPNHEFVVSMPRTTTVTFDNKFYHSVSKMWNIIPDQYVTRGLSKFKRYVSSQAFLDKLTEERLLPTVDCR